ncbi:MAG: family N-acetyltransferase [Flaviaesturariibacter sp.]|nr:family N-acetyltransferase [Flaviaesturariibacter sp.]
MTAPITYLSHKQIDKSRWDEGIQRAPNGLVYATSAYLDAMAPGWDALVQGDYDHLFPLPWRRKWGVRYLFQPLLTAQLGLFGGDLTEARFNSFLQSIPRKFRYLDISLNHRNGFTGSVFPLSTRTNYVLDLGRPYEEILATYRQNAKRNIRKAQQLGCTEAADLPVASVTKLASLHIPDEAGLARFTELYGKLREMSKAMTYGILDGKGQLLASCVFLFSHGRAYYILVGNHPNGRTLGASHLLLDAFIRAHAGTELLLDFEGSDLRNLAFFYSSFGARTEYYPALRLNRLPWWCRWMKTA